MTVTSYQIQSVLRIYGRQLRRTLKNRSLIGMAVRSDPISPQVKRKQVIEQIAQEVLKKITMDGVYNEIGKAALAKLVHEVGQNVEIIPDSQGEWKFNLIPQENKTVRGQGRSLYHNLDYWKERLYEITFEIIDQNTVTR